VQVGNRSLQITLDQALDNYHLEELEEQVEVETIDEQAVPTLLMAETSSHLQVILQYSFFILLNRGLQI